MNWPPPSAVSSGCEKKPKGPTFLAQLLAPSKAGPVDSVLLMAGHSWLSLRNSTVALVVNVGLNVLLIPLYGISGAAIAWAVCAGVTRR